MSECEQKGRCLLTDTHVKKIEDMYMHTREILTYAKHLEKLDALNDIRDHLISAAIGKDQIQTKTALLIFKILGVVICALLAVLLFLLIGEKADIIGMLHR